MKNKVLTLFFIFLFILFTFSCIFANVISQMMKRRRYIACLLMLVSMIMLTASVFPHHHHQELFCLQHDATETSPDCQQKESNPESTCQACCVTKFHCSDPDQAYDSMEPHYSLESILFTITDIYSLPLRPEEEKVSNFPLYHEKLYDRHISAAVGLRAPPSFMI